MCSYPDGQYTTCVFMQKDKSPHKILLEKLLWQSLLGRGWYWASPAPKKKSAEKRCSWKLQGLNKSPGTFLQATNCTENYSNNPIIEHSRGNCIALINEVNFPPERRTGCHAITADKTVTPAQAFCGPLGLHFAVWSRAPRYFSFPTLRLHFQPCQEDPNDRRRHACCISSVQHLRTFLVATNPSSSHPSSNAAAEASLWPAQGTPRVWVASP